jgi:hypothetical protein
MKRLPIVLLTVAVITAGVLLYVRFFVPAGKSSSTKTSSPQTTSASVSSWDPTTGSLGVTMADKKTVVLQLEPPKTIIIIPISAAGQPKDERIVMTTHDNWWFTAFCPGDMLEIVMGASPVPSEVHSLGPRSCVRMNLPALRVGQ